MILLGIIIFIGGGDSGMRKRMKKRAFVIKRGLYTVSEWEKFHHSSAQLAL